jgi:hypothetical protein
MTDWAGALTPLVGPVCGVDSASESGSTSRRIAANTMSATCQE